MSEALAEAYDRALALEKAGETEAAASAWREVLRLDPEDRGGAAVRLAALGRGESPERAPPAYVATLFDQHAEAFEDILVGQLGYRAPERLAEMLRALAPEARGLSLLDLGCGTGLVPRALGEVAGHRTGVDLSEEMLGVADAAGLYDELYVGDAVAFLESEAGEDDPAGPWDLIAAADVLPYLGPLEPLFAGVALRLAPGGRFLFSTETFADPDAFGGRGWRVGPHQRFHHGEPYVRDALAAAGLEVEALAPAVIRTNDGRPEPGRLVIARRPA
jgi:predicted TPR repeat methyltransferase